MKNMKTVELLVLQNYLPFNIYFSILYNVLKKIGFAVRFIRSLNEHKKETDYLVIYTNHIDTIFNANIKSKIIFINADHYITRLHSERVRLGIYINSTNPNNTYIWEYNPLNVEYYNQYYSNKKISFIPLEYSNILELIYKNTKRIPYNNKDIDVLFLGYVNARRTPLINEIRSKCKVECISDISDTTKFCNWIERAKIVLNIFSNKINKPFDYYRLALLYANKIFVINEEMTDFDPILQSNLVEVKEHMINVKYDEIPSAVEKYLKYSETEISTITTNTYEAFKKCNMEENIIKFFEQENN
jgi:hypothetical protein